MVRYTNTVLKTVHCLKYIRDIYSLFQHDVEDCSLSEVYPWQWFVIPTLCWRLFIVCNISLTFSVYQRGSEDCLPSEIRLTFTACSVPYLCNILQVAAVTWWLLYYRDTQNVVATNFKVRHNTSEPNRAQSPEYGRTGGPIGVVLQCRASLQPAT